MEWECKSGQMEQSMRENGSKAKPEVTGNSTTRMEIFMREIGSTTKLMAKAHIFTPTGPGILAIGARIYKMERVFTSGPTAAAMMVSSEQEKSTE